MQTVKAGPIDLATPTGQMVARVLGASPARRSPTSPTGSSATGSAGTGSTGSAVACGSVGSGSVPAASRSAAACRRAWWAAANASDHGRPRTSSGTEAQTRLGREGAACDCITATRPRLNDLALRRDTPA